MRVMLTLMLVMLTLMARMRVMLVCVMLLVRCCRWRGMVQWRLRLDDQVVTSPVVSRSGLLTGDEDGEDRRVKRGVRQ